MYAGHVFTVVAHRLQNNNLLALFYHNVHSHNVNLPGLKLSVCNNSLAHASESQYIIF